MCTSVDSFLRRVFGVTMPAGEKFLWAVMTDEKHGYQIHVSPRYKHTEQTPDSNQGAVHKSWHLNKFKKVEFPNFWQGKYPCYWQA
jgi:phospholipase C